MTTPTRRPRDIGDLLRLWRIQAELTIDEMTRVVQDTAPWLRRASREYVRRYELGVFADERVDIPYLIVVCSILGHDPVELGGDIGESVEGIRALLAKKRAKRTA